MTYTIPPAIGLSLLYRPFCTRLDVYKVVFLVTIAVVATIPWDSYLIHQGIWTYPPSVILGPRLFDIPLEEVFFFVIQTYNTSLLYLLFSKPTLHPVYLRKEKTKDRWKYYKLGGQIVGALVFKKALEMVKEEGPRTYMGLILIWAFPFLWVLYGLAYQLILGMPLTNTIVPIVLPTFYLWIVDTLALKRGTWSISTSTKTGIQLWPGLEIEEAVFFLLTNTLITFGLIAFDNAIAILNAFPALYPTVPSLPSPVLLVKALLLPTGAYIDDTIIGLKQASARLKKKSRSFYLASAMFQGRLRIDLILLYSFCRVADDLIDTAKTPSEARQWIERLRKFLDLSYSGPTQKPDGSMVKAKDVNQGPATLFAVQTFPHDIVLALMQLPTNRLSKEPLYGLLQGFEMDTDFANNKNPIKSDADLDLYGSRVAGTVAELVLELVTFHHPSKHGQEVKESGRKMGTALQYVNIARDLSVDAAIGRCYVPPGWLKKEKLTPESFMDGLVKTDKQDEFFMSKVAHLRNRLLDRAFAFYDETVIAIDRLPSEATAPMRVAVESYMQIGRELRRPEYSVKAGRATVPKWKRLIVAWRALSKG